MNNKKYKIKETIDVFISENNETVILTFHIMTTRNKIELKTNKNVAEFIANLNGINSINDIRAKMGNLNKEDIEKLLDFLITQRLVYDVEQKEHNNIRFTRQITFWDDFVLGRSGGETQSVLEKKKIVLFGCGAVGSKIVEILVRAGVSDLILLDYKKLLRSNRLTHSYYDPEKVDALKVNVLSDFLYGINKKISVKTFFDKILPDTDLSNLIPDDTDLIINSCDEPYIGHISLKVGRYAQIKKIPFYVSGGFDAHLMSSGELIFPPKTPCIDCVQSTFSNALKEWKPIYNISESRSSNRLHSDSDKRSNIFLGGSAGLSLMSGFSANLCCMQLLHFLLDDVAFEYKNSRLEFLPNIGTMTEFNFKKQPNCEICNG